MGTARGEGREGCSESECGVPESGRERPASGRKRRESGRERPESGRERPESERGAVDSFLVFTPILLTMILVFALFDYGASTNELTNQAILVGRQLARYPDSSDLETLTEEVLVRQGINVSDFHVMRITLGNRIFIQLTLIGRKFDFGRYGVAPAGKSLTLVDYWS